MGSIPGLGRCPWRRKWQPISVFLPGKSHGQRRRAGYSPWDWLRDEQTQHNVLLSAVNSRQLGLGTRQVLRCSSWASFWIIRIHWLYSSLLSENEINILNQTIQLDPNPQVRDDSLGGVTPLQRQQKNQELVCSYPKDSLRAREKDWYPPP